MSIGGKSEFEQENTTNRSSEDKATSGVKTSQLSLDQAGIDKIIQDVLGGAGGLSEIFAGEQVAGVFDSSTANLAAGDLAAKLAGEIAKITGKTITTDEEDVSITGKSRTEKDTFGTSVEGEFSLF